VLPDKELIKALGRAPLIPLSGPWTRAVRFRYLQRDPISRRPACDFFAAGGCGSGACYNSDDSGGRIVIGKGDCRELEVWGPNTCYCHTTAIIFME